MSPEVSSIFSAILSKCKLTGPVLEIGVTYDDNSLINLPCLKEIPIKIGVNLDDFNSDKYKFIMANGNDLSQFESGSFQIILCNSVLEHDLFFWKTLSEIKRVAASGGIIIIGVPGYRDMGLYNFLFKSKMIRKLIRIISPNSLNKITDASSITLGEHFYPGDFYRFSKASIEKLFMADLVNVEIYEVMLPPRFIGFGVKP